MFLLEKANGRRTCCVQISFLSPYVSDVGNDASGVRGSLDNSIKGDIMTIIGEIGV